MNRRTFNRQLGLGLLSAAAIPIVGCSGNQATTTYDSLAAATWRHSDPRISGSKQQMELVRYATLAANSHNTQPWRFRIEANRITILPDFTRRCPAVDPDDHHLFASLGCAAENLVLAAKAHGLAAHASLVGDEVQIDLEAAAATESPLFMAIPERQCTRAEYDGKSIGSDKLAKLEAIAGDDGVMVQLFTDKNNLEVILEYVVTGNTAQMRDEVFVKELKDWIRFSESSVVEHSDGLFSASSGNPAVPEWIGNLLLRFVFTEDGENDKYRNHIRSSAGIIVFISEENNKEHWFRAGRAYQRFALQSTAMGLQHAFINQAVEVPEVRVQLADYLEIGDRRPDMVVRFGYGPVLPRSLRRPVDRVLV